MSQYCEARANLADADRDMLDRWEAAAAVLTPAGPTVVTNLRNEAHLVGNPPEARSLALQAFLLRIASLFGSSSAKQAFEEAAMPHLLKGRLSASNPSILLRFRPIDAFGESVARANGELSVWKRNPDEYVTDLLENWDTIGREKVSMALLGPRPLVFVTFEKPDGHLVTDLFGFGPEIMDALGVKLQASQEVIGLRYPSSTDAPLKYPTVADAGWSQYFAVAKPTDAHGWTRPISDHEAEGWPEAVHKNRNSDLVAERPSRYPKTLDA